MLPKNFQTLKKSFLGKFSQSPKIESFASTESPLSSQPKFVIGEMPVDSE